MKILTKIQCAKFVDLAIKKLAKYIIDNKLNGITTGISGGINSAVVSVIGLQTINHLCQQGKSVSFRYYFLNCESDKTDYHKAGILAKKFNFKLQVINLTSWYRQSPLLAQIPNLHPKKKIAQGNIKARLRMIALYQIALLNNYIYLDTDDLSEYWMGFWTRHGDEGDVKIIQSITKTECYDLGEYLHVPIEILQSDPGDGLGVTVKNKAIEQLELPYIYIEYIISLFIQNNFDINGLFNQLSQDKFVNLISKTAKQLHISPQQVYNTLKRALNTSYKRKFGENVANLLPNRDQFKFPKIGSKLFNQIYLKAITKEMS